MLSSSTFENSLDDLPRKRARKSNPIYTAHGFVPTNEVDFGDEDVPNDAEYAPKKEVNHDDE